MKTMSRAWPTGSASARGSCGGRFPRTAARRPSAGAKTRGGLFRQHVGASPIAVAQTRRVLLAKQLIHDTQLSMAEVALASGFNSVRRFNETFQALYGRPPGQLRRSRKADVSATAAGELTLRLPYRPPYDWNAILA